MQTTAYKRKRRHERIRSKVAGTPECPRLSVFRSNKYISAQLIDDTKHETLVTSHGRDLASAKGKPLVEMAKLVGADIAKKAGGKKVKQVVFDRGGFSYAGAIRALAESAREHGLVF